MSKEPNPHLLFERDDRNGGRLVNGIVEPFH
jgi:hypothetical protein